MLVQESQYIYTERPKMVSKRLKTHFFRSYEQFFWKNGFTRLFLTVFFLNRRENEILVIETLLPRLWGALALQFIRCYGGPQPYRSFAVVDCPSRTLLLLLWAALAVQFVRCQGGSGRKPKRWVIIRKNRKIDFSIKFRPF